MILSRSLSLMALIAFVLFGSLAADEFSPEEIANTFSAKEVDVPPVPVKQAAPVLTEDLAGQTGRVYVGFIVDARGKVVAPRIMKTENELLNDVAMECVFGWEFKPAIRGGSAVSMRVVVPLRFS
jgi:TonB family protein